MQMKSDYKSTYPPWRCFRKITISGWRLWRNCSRQNWDDLKSAIGDRDGERCKRTEQKVLSEVYTYVCMSVCVCVRYRWESVCVCVCECECEGECERQRESVCVCERESVCVWERERVDYVKRDDGWCVFLGDEEKKVRRIEMNKVYLKISPQNEFLSKLF